MTAMMLVRVSEEVCRRVTPRQKKCQPAAPAEVIGLQTEGPPSHGSPSKSSDVGPLGAYFSAVDTLVKVVVKAVPVACTAAMIAMEMPAAIRPYSMAVAPDSSLQNARKRDM